MTNSKKDAAPFDKVGECLYRYRSSGVYYARVKTLSKEIRRSLETRDRNVAKRKLSDLKRELGLLDLEAGDLTLAELCERYFKTVLHQKPSTVQGKRMVIDRMLADWPGGSSRRLSVVRTSEIREFLSASVDENSMSLYTHYVFVVRAVFDVALQDRLVAASPAADIKAVKRDKPIRRTPSFGEFQKIVEDIRSQAFNADCQDSADFVEFLGLAGLGQAEASSLVWGDTRFIANDTSLELRTQWNPSALSYEARWYNGGRELSEFRKPFCADVEADARVLACATLLKLDGT